MDVVLHRKWLKDGYVVGRLYIDGVFFCNSLEDTDRGLQQFQSVSEILAAKIAGATAIPAGDYKVTRTYSPRFKRLVPQVMNVKGFSGVRIHAGNSSADTEGCILLGDNTMKGRLTNSRARVTKFETLLQIEGGTCDLHIVYDYKEDE